MPEADEPLEPGLYLVATPIGNLEDMTLRALRVLRSVDRIACEDTRQTQKLLNHFAISTATISYHEHNEQARTQDLLALLQQGSRIALVTDAGMPVFSDPGLEIVRAAIEAGIPVVPIPGANAALTALIASGLQTDQFLYAGFLAAKAGARLTELERLATKAPGMTLILYEAPHRILETLTDVEAVWGADVRVVIGRELTKLHEEMLRGTPGEVRAALAARDRVRGEMVLLIEAKPLGQAGPKGGSILQQIAHLNSKEGLEEKDALKRIAREHGVSKSDIYRALQRERSKK